MCWNIQNNGNAFLYHWKCSWGYGVRSHTRTSLNRSLRFMWKLFLLCMRPFTSCEWQAIIGRIQVDVGVTSAVAPLSPIIPSYICSNLAEQTIGLIYADNEGRPLCFTYIWRSHHGEWRPMQTIPLDVYLSMHQMLGKTSIFSELDLSHSCLAFLWKVKVPHSRLKWPNNKKWAVVLTFRQFIVRLFMNGQFHVQGTRVIII